MEGHELVLVHFFRTFHPDAYEILQNNPELVLRELRELHQEKFKPDSKAAIQNYLRHSMENYLHQDLLDEKNEITALEFREIRAHAWQAEKIKALQDDFVQVFINEKKEITHYFL